jgi:hypothetical protein
MACSSALRTPTPLNSTDPQCEQWGDTTNSTAIHPGVPEMARELARRGDGFGLSITAQVGAAGFARGFHLFVGPYIGFRGSNLRPCAGHLTFVAFGESLVHTLDYTCGTPDRLLRAVAIRTFAGEECRYEYRHGRRDARSTRLRWWQVGGKLPIGALSQ